MGRGQRQRLRRLEESVKDQCGFGDCNKCTILILDSQEGELDVGVRDLSILSTNFLQSKTVLILSSSLKVTIVQSTSNKQKHFHAGCIFLDVYNFVF